jgi:sarcosine oxidase subunit beta
MIRSEDPEAAELGVGMAVGQTPEGTLLIGGTREFVGYDTATTPEATAAVLRHAVSILPALAKVHVIRTFAGLRPYTPDGMPILGPVDGLPGFVMAAGHEGDGIALAPITGKIIAEYIANGTVAKGLEELNLRRFKTQPMAK